jgi:Cys-rich repeat protein
VQCQANADCAPSMTTPFCNGATCVQCLTSADCTGGTRCRGGACR